jgi:dTDP-4-dehydrorhamnose reductase
MATKTIVIYDISTFVGSNLANFFKKKYKLFGFYRVTPVEIPGVICLPLNVLDRRDVRLTMSTIAPDVIIFNTDANTDSCEKSDYKDIMIHRSGIININEYCKKNNTKFIYISSHFVFRGEDDLYVETRISAPLTVYGKILSEMEFVIQRSFQNYLIIRTAHLYGRSILYDHPMLLEKLERDINESKSMAIDNKVGCGFLDVDYLALVIDLALDNNSCNKMWQLSSKDIMTNFEFANLYAKIFYNMESFGKKGVWPFPFKSIFVANKVSREINHIFHMSVANLENSLGISCPTIQESLEYTFKKFAGKDGPKTREVINFI